MVAASVDANDICNAAIDLYRDIEKARFNGLKWTQELSAVIRVLRLAGTQCMAFSEELEQMFEKKRVDKEQGVG
jgi:hypothetical protein